MPTVGVVVQYLLAQSTTVPPSIREVDVTPSLMLSRAWRVAGVAGSVRLVVLLACVLLDSLVDDYDTSGSLPFRSGSNPREGEREGEGEGGIIIMGGGSWVDWGVGAGLKGLHSWDAVYFVGISERGYETEQAHAFFPLLPLCVRALSKGLSWLPANQFTITMLSGFLFTNCCFILASVLFYWLSLAVLKNEKIAFCSSILFCLNPANIFMSSIYTESPFAMLFFGACLMLHKKRFWGSTVFFALTVATRGNGIVCAGFLLFEAVDSFFPFSNLLVPTVYHRLMKIGAHWLFTLFRVGLMSLPYIGIQLGHVMVQFYNTWLLWIYSELLLESRILSLLSVQAASELLISHTYGNYVSMWNCGISQNLCGTSASQGIRN
ncbi:GPI mannosyltransferase 2 [Pelomyxa schiedti]|nr:GPI mannosyltransferase 2 [Pelomyxa schiedti]